MFSLHKFVTEEINGAQQIQEVEFDKPIDYFYAPPSCIDIVCKNKEASIVLSFTYNISVYRNSLANTSCFAIKFNSGLPNLLVALTEDYCQKRGTKVMGNQHTHVISLYSRQDKSEYKEYFCDYFNGVENYFFDYFYFDRSLKDNIVKCFDELRKPMLLPERQNTRTPGIRISDEWEGEKEKKKEKEKEKEKETSLVLSDHEIGIEHYKNGAYAKAFAFFQAAINTAPKQNHKEARIMKGVTLLCLEAQIGEIIYNDNDVHELIGYKSEIFKKIKVMPLKHPMRKKIFSKAVDEQSISFARTFFSTIDHTFIYNLFGSSPYNGKKETLEKIHKELALTASQSDSVKLPEVIYTQITKNKIS